LLESVLRANCLTAILADLLRVEGWHRTIAEFLQIPRPTARASQRKGRRPQALDSEAKQFKNKSQVASETLPGGLISRGGPWLTSSTSFSQSVRPYYHLVNLGAFLEAADGGLGYGIDELPSGESLFGLTSSAMTK
jgi:hypothetical protein